MCLPELQKPSDDSLMSDEEVAPEEQSDEDIYDQSISDVDNESLGSNIGN